MKKSVKVILICFLVLFVGVGAVVLTIFLGNPVSKVLATQSAKRYMEVNFKDTDFEIDSVSYDFKNTKYLAYVKSPSSIDSHFTITLGMDGKAYGDSYEDDVLSGWNTMRRVDDEYNSRVQKAFESKDFPYSLDFVIGDIEITSEEHKDDIYTPDYAILMNELELDREYDLKAIGTRAGHISVYIYEENLTAEKLSEVILSIKQLMDKSGISFYAIDCSLKYPLSAEGEMIKSDSIYVNDFLYSDIYEEGMLERVEQHIPIVEFVD